MSAPTYQAEPQIQYLYQLVRDIAAGNLQLPRFQRPYVWTEEQRLELLRSIHTGTPIGTIMLWRTTSLEMKCYNEIGGYEVRPPSGPVRSYIIDGHQRLATAFSALHAPPAGAPSDYAAYYDLMAEDFVSAAGRGQPDPRWLPLHFVMDFSKLLPFQRSLMNHSDADTLVRRADTVIKAFAEYKLPVITVVTDDLDAIARTFQRVNSQGTVMSEVHMISALTWSKDFDLNEQIAALKEEYLAPLGWGDLDDELVLRACKLALGFQIYDKNVDEISRKIRGASKVFDEVVQSLITVIRFLDQACGIRSPAVLPYSSHLISLLEAVRRDPARVEGAKRVLLTKWFWTLAYSTRRYSPERQLELLDQLSASAQGSSLMNQGNLLVEPLPRVFDFRRARCRLLALRMAELAGGGAADSLALHGSDAVPHFLYGYRRVAQHLFESPANRLVIAPAHASEERTMIREACHKRSRSKDDVTLLKRHAISPEAADAYAADDLESFYALRLRTLEDLEGDFARRAGLMTP